ncbi:acetylornithine deacetylase [Rothia sp. AR01]|uniref:Acetylornithine deacetylase n=1 Tax=Rothia santali TaxID=2949643 RepID=A0A9X2HDN7_9MICC|nr:acetylornithine deacetylase [Rothia santali]MCP3426200.1 acetylornithine deacetylase [Rothia santali]
MAQNANAPQHTPASLPWTEKLIRIPTVSYESNLELIEVLEAEFSRHGIESHRSYSEDRTRANLFATVPAADGGTSGGVVISGHTDVVPVEGQPWDTDPFEPVLRDGRLYGRGSSDMKSYIGAAMWLLPRIAEAELAEPIHFAFSYDEEPGCLGAPRMIEEFGARGIRPEYCVVGEPTLMNVIQAHKSPQRGRITFRGVPKHSSMAPYGVNAVHYAGEFIHFYKGIADAWRESGPFDEGFGITHTTGGVNFARGGIAYNIVAEECVLEYDFRAIPATPPDEIRARIEAFLFEELEPAMRREVERVRGLGGADEAALDAVGISLEILADVPGLNTADDDPAIALGEELGGVRGGPGPDGTPLPSRVPYGTEGGQFQAAEIRTIVCGPGDIAQAHTANEWIELSQIEACEKFLEAVLERARA